jgi:hypothetical protein
MIKKSTGVQQWYTNIPLYYKMLETALHRNKKQRLAMLRQNNKKLQGVPKPSTELQGTNLMKTTT